MIQTHNYKGTVTKATGSTGHCACGWSSDEMALRRTAQDATAAHIGQALESPPAAIERSMTSTPLDLLDTHDTIRQLLLSAADAGLLAPGQATTQDSLRCACLLWYEYDRTDPADAQRILAWMRTQSDSGGLGVGPVTDGTYAPTVTVDGVHGAVALRLCTYAAHVCVRVDRPSTETVWRLADDTRPTFGMADPVEMGADR